MATDKSTKITNINPSKNRIYLGELKNPKKAKEIMENTVFQNQFEVHVSDEGMIAIEVIQGKPTILQNNETD